MEKHQKEVNPCVSQESVEEKTNEIPAVQDLIQITNIKDCVLTWDALNTQTKTVDLVIKAKGNYVGALKKNHKDFYEDVLLFLKTECDDLKTKKHCYKKDIEKAHSSTITREYFFTQDIDWLPNKQEWIGLKSIGLEKKTIEKLDGKNIVEKRLFIASIEGINLFSHAVRSHWQVENKLHWHLDYTFKDDQNTTLECNGAKNLQIIKKIALAILNIVKPLFKKSLKKIRFITSLDVENTIETIFKCLNADGLAQLWEKKI
jgi:predicted transposase YbfD/YdcC